MKDKKVIKNAKWMIYSRIIQMLIGLITSTLSARYLGPSGFGIINYAASLTSFFVPLMQLGLNSTLVQEIISNEDKEGEILGTSLGLCLVSSFLCIVSIVSFSAVANWGDKTTILICLLHSIVLIFQAFDLFQYWFQAKLLSKYTSIISLLAYILVSAYRIYILATAKSIYWFSIWEVIDYFLIAIGVLVAYKKLGGQRLRFSVNIIKMLVSKSKYYILSNLMVNVLAQTDKIMLKFWVSDFDLGCYSAAVTCAGLTSFVFGAIIDSARPSIFEHQTKDEKEYKRSIITLYSIINLLSLLQSVVMMIGSKLIINLLYGKDYYLSAQLLKIVVWYTTFAHIGWVRSIWILAENKQKYLLTLNLSGIVINVLLNFLLIPFLGAFGAAIASLVAQIFINIVIPQFMPQLRENNILIFKSFNPKYLLSYIGKKK